MDKREKLIIEIHALKKVLEDKISKSDIKKLNSKEILTLSQEIDVLIAKYYLI